MRINVDVQDRCIKISPSERPLGHRPTAQSCNRNIQHEEMKAPLPFFFFFALEHTKCLLSNKNTAA